MPIGVASMSFTCAMPSASTALTWGGSGLPAVCAASAGTRLSRISVVLPEPDTPVTTVSRPLGMSTSSGLTVWMASGRKMDAPLGKQLRRRAVPGRSTPLPAQKRADLGRRVPGQVGHRALGNDVPAARTGLGAHLDEPVRLRQHLCVVINEHHRVAVGDQVVHDAVQAHDVGGVQPDGRLVQHVQNAGGAVAHGAGQLHPLALAGGKRWRPRGPASGSRAPDPAAAARSRGTTRRCSRPWGASLPAGWRARRPPSRQSAVSVILQASSSPMPRSLRRTGGLRQARAAAVRADILASGISPPASCPSRP